MSQFRQSTYLDELDDACRSLTMLRKYGRNLTQLAAQQKLPKCYAREAEIEFIQINRNRITKPNILLIGPSGCGKTAIVEGLAQHLEQALYERWTKKHDVDVTSETPLVFELSPVNLIGGAIYRGSFEERIQQIMEEVGRCGRRVILFFDEIHSMVTMGKSSTDDGMGLGDILKPALARGEFILIGSTTQDEYDKYLKKDAALVRRFNVLTVGAIDRDKRVECALRILADFSEKHEIPFCCENTILESYLEGILSNQFLDTSFPCEFTDAVDFMFAKAKYEHTEQLGLSQLQEALSKLRF